MIKSLIIEDEVSAQEVLQNYIDKTPFISCLGVYESGLEVPPEDLEHVDVLFLDIQLPELDGLSFLKTLKNPPKVIVTTAFSNYAIEAFEEAVVDYLVKPFSYDRFFKAVSRIRNLVAAKKKYHAEPLFLYADKTIYKTTTDEILFLKAEVDYVKVVMKDRSVLVLDSLRNWEDKLRDYNFVRTHRSFIVNLDKIEKVTGNQVYIEAKAIPIGATYKSQFFKQFKQE